MCRVDYEALTAGARSLSSADAARVGVPGSGTGFESPFESPEGLVSPPDSAATRRSISSSLPSRSLCSTATVRSYLAKSPSARVLLF